MPTSQTPIQRAISEIEAQIANSHNQYMSEIVKYTLQEYLKELRKLLPYEKEFAEKAYIEGQLYEACYIGYKCFSDFYAQYETKNHNH